MLARTKNDLCKAAANDSQSGAQLTHFSGQSSGSIFPPKITQNYIDYIYDFIRLCRLSVLAELLSVHWWSICNTFTLFYIHLADCLLEFIRIMP